jgi:type I restriction enzyme S subunit
VRDGMEWKSFCDLEFDIPDVPTQQKYVDIYDAMYANQTAYEKGLDDLKLTCDAYIEELRRKMPCEIIGPYIQECNEKNENNALKLFQGVNVDHVFTEPKRVANDSENGCIVRMGQFAFNKVMKANGTKLPIALREGPDCVVSNSYQVFEVSNKKKLLPEYLMLWMNRVETQRYAGYISFGTTRDIFSFDDMCNIQIPMPSIEIQSSIADIYKVYKDRKRINEKLKQQIKDICPILIKGAIEEGKSKRG